MNKVQAPTKQADTKKANVSTANTSNPTKEVETMNTATAQATIKTSDVAKNHANIASNPTKEVETMNTATAQATVKTSDVAKNHANIASNKEAVKQQEQPKADNKMNTVANNTSQNAKNGVKVEDTKAAAPVAPKTEQTQTNSTTAVKEEKMTEAKMTYQQMEIKLSEMGARFPFLTADEKKEFFKLDEEFTKAKTERQGKLDKVQSSILQFVVEGYTLNDMFATKEELKSLVMGANIKPTELFDIAVLKEAVGIGSSKKKVDDGEEGAEKRTRAAAEPRPSDSKPLLIAQPKDGTKGKKFAYRQGRVYEVKKQNKPLEIVQPAVKEAMAINEFLKANHTKEALEKFMTEEGKRYFANEGKEEFADLLRVLKENLADAKA